MLKCPACLSESVQYTRDRYKFGGHIFKRVCCKSCDLHFWDPLLVDEAKLYDDEFVPLYKAYHQGFMRVPINRPCFDSLPINGGKLLDVGCANGGFMRYAADKGFDCYGIDFDQRSVKEAQKSGVSNVWPVSLREFSNTFGRNHVGTFDVVTFFDVLEHQTEPKIFVDEVREMLAPGGYVVGKVPNRNRVLAKVRRELDYDYPPHHTLMWSADSVRKFLEGSGFDRIRVDVDEFKFWPYIWHMEKKIIGRRLQKAIKGKVFSVDRDIAYVPVENLEAATGKKGGLVRSLKKIEDWTFAAITGAMFPLLKNRGAQIYFLARKS